MEMYSKVKLCNIYKNLSEEDKDFQLGEQQYNAYEGAINRQMSHFTQEAIDFQTENMRQEEINESCSRAR